MRSYSRPRLPLAVAAVAVALSCCLLPSATSASTKSQASAWREVTFMRTASSKTFSDGAGDFRTRLYGYPVNYRSGKNWTRIDSDLVTSGRTGAYKNAANSFGVQLERSLAGAYLRFTAPKGRASFSVSLEVVSGARSLREEANGLTYRGVGAKTEIAYQVTPDGLKETIELIDSSAPSSYVFELRPEGGERLSAVKRPDGSVDFYARGHSLPVFSILAPTVADSAGDGERNPPAEGMASMSVRKQADGRFRIAVSINRQWLRVPTRAFPVYLDPSYVTNAPDARDGFFNLTTGQNAPPNVADNLWVGYSNGTLHTYDSVANFDLSAIPVGAAINDVGANLYLTDCLRILHCVSGSSAGYVRMHRLTSPWSPSSHWASITFDPVTLASRHFDAGTSAGYDSVNAWYRLDDGSGYLTNLVQEMTDLQTTQLGFLFEGPVSPNVGYEFASSRVAGKGPYLDIGWASVAPSNIDPPTIGGNATDGQTLSAVVGSWDGTRPLTYRYQWRRCDQHGDHCADIAGATSSHYSLTVADVGRTICLRVTVTSPYGSASATSNPTGIVQAIPPANVSRPTISGTARDGETLTASTGTWSGSPVYAGSPGFHFDYQWLRCDSAVVSPDVLSCGSIGDGNPTYTLTNADVGKRIGVEVTATNDAGSANADSSSTDVVSEAPPRARPGEPPTISVAFGHALRDGETLDASSGGWDGTPLFAGNSGFDFSYKWLRCNDAGAECEAIAGETHSSYKLTSTDVGSTILVEITAQNDAGAAQASSDPTAVVVAAPPANTAVPAISGTIEDGEPLTGSSGAWDGTPPITFSYQWRRCDSVCSDISGAMSSTYVLSQDDVGYTIEFEVTATNTVATVTATSPVTDVVVAAAPSNTALPTIGGMIEDGKTLTGSSGTWDGTPPITFSYQWRRCDPVGDDCSDIVGATETTYQVTGDDIAHTIRLLVTATNAGGSASVASAATGEGEATKPSNTALPTTSGTAKDGETLSGTTGDWDGTPPVDYAYQWFRCDSGGAGCSNISGATGATYVLTSADVGHTIRLQTTASNAAGSTSAQSNATDLVVAIKPSSTTPPAISGTPNIGERLTASNGSWSGSRPIVFTFQWLRCDTSGNGCAGISGATNSTYTTGSADEGHGLRALVTATNTGGSATATSSAVLVLTATPSATSGISLELVASPSIVSPGDPVTYKLEATNSTSADRLLGHLSLAIPSGFRYSQSSIQGGPNVAPAISNGTLTWSGLVDLPAGQSKTVTVISGAAISPGTYYSSATATASGVSILPLDHAGAVTVLPKLAVSVTAGSDMATPGEHIGYTIKITNGTNSAIAFDQVRDQLPSGFKYIAGTTAGAFTGDPTINGTSLVWSFDRQLDSGGAVAISFGAASATSGTAISHQVDVTNSGNSRGSGEGGRVDVASDSSLALEYRPFVLFDASEPWRPLNVDMFLSERFNHSNGHQVCAYPRLSSAPVRLCDHDSVKGIKQLIANDNRNDHYLAIYKDMNMPGMKRCTQGADNRLCDRNRGPRTAIYYHVTKNREEENKVVTYIDYWFFYRYNNPHWHLRADLHEGDWEHMLVAVGSSSDKKGANCTQHGTSWVGISAHGPLYKYQCKVLLWSGETRSASGNHVETFVADGTHAMYPRPCFEDNTSCRQLVKQCRSILGVGHICKEVEGGFDGRAEWGRNSTKACLKGSPCVLPIKDEKVNGIIRPVTPYWMTWAGTWGGSDASVQNGYWQALKTQTPKIKTPTLKSNAFEQPWLSGTTCDRTVFDYGNSLCEETPGELEPIKVEIPPVVKKPWTSKHPPPIRVGKKNVNADVKTLLTDKKYDFHFIVKKVDKYNFSVEKGLVIKTKPVPGTPVYKGGQVTVWVSRGPIIMPDVTDKKWDRAESTLKAEPYNFDVTVKRLPHPSEPGTVYSSSPPAGKAVHAGTHVTIKVSKGLEDVRGMTPGNATKALRAAPWFLKFGKTPRDGGYTKYKKGTISNTDPAPGSKIKPGATVYFYISKGSRPAKKGLEPPLFAYRLSFRSDVVEASTLSGIAKDGAVLGAPRLDDMRAVETKDLKDLPEIMRPATRSEVRKPVETVRPRGAAVKSTRRTQTAATRPPSACDEWFGPFVVAAACDPKQAGVTSSNTGTPGTFIIEAPSGVRTDSSPGVAQAVGSPLQPGTTIILAGTAPKGTELALRIEAKGGSESDVLFKGLGIEQGGRIVATVRKDGAFGGKDGVPDVRLTTPKGTIKPSRILTTPKPPRIAKMKRFAHKLRVRFLANAPRTVFQFWTATKALYSRTVKTKAGHWKTIYIKLSPRPKATYLTAVSLNPGNMNSTPVVRKVPRRH